MIAAEFSVAYRRARTSWGSVRTAGANLIKLQVRIVLNTQPVSACLRAHYTRLGLPVAVLREPKIAGCFLEAIRAGARVHVMRYL